MKRTRVDLIITGTKGIYRTVGEMPDELVEQDLERQKSELSPWHYKLLEHEFGAKSAASIARVAKPKLRGEALRREAAKEHQRAREFIKESGITMGTLACASILDQVRE